MTLISKLCPFVRRQLLMRADSAVPAATNTCATTTDTIPTEAAKCAPAGGCDLDAQFGPGRVQCCCIANQSLRCVWEERGGPTWTTERRWAPKERGEVHADGGQTAAQPRGESNRAVCVCASDDGQSKAGGMRRNDSRRAAGVELTGWRSGAAPAQIPKRRAGCAQQKQNNRETE